MQPTGADAASGGQGECRTRAVGQEQGGISRGVVAQHLKPDVRNEKLNMDWHAGKIGSGDLKSPTASLGAFPKWDKSLLSPRRLPVTSRYLLGAAVAPVGTGNRIVQL